MKAIVQRAYGTPDVLALEDIPTPEVKPDDVLVRVEAAALNAGDHFTVRGQPWLVRFFVGFPRPKGHVLGWDLAGRVAEVGTNVRRFRPGDEVYGSGKGTLAEFASLPQHGLAAKPANLDTMQAAAVLTAAITALQGLRDAAKVSPVNASSSTGPRAASGPSTSSSRRRSAPRSRACAGTATSSWCARSAPTTSSTRRTRHPARRSPIRRTGAATRSSTRAPASTASR